MVNLGKTKRFKQYPSWVPFAFITPFFIGFIFTSGAPIIYNFYLSLTDSKGFNKSNFVGIDNYKSLFSDQLFYTALINNLKIMVVFIPIMLILGIMVAYLLHVRYVKHETFFQNLYFLPYIIIPVAVGAIFRSLLDWQYGLLNKFLATLGLINEPINWLNTPELSTLIIAFVIIWQSVGYAAIMYTAGLKGISKEIFEACIVDGANATQMFLKISLPLLRPITSFLLITNIIWGFQIFDETVVLYSTTSTGWGGPSFSALTLIQFLYLNAFRDFKAGYGAAIGYVVAIIIIITSLLSRKFIEDNESD